MERLVSTVNFCLARYRERRSPSDCCYPYCYTTLVEASVALERAGRGGRGKCRGRAQSDCTSLHCGRMPPCPQFSVSASAELGGRQPISHTHPVWHRRGYTVKSLSQPHRIAGTFEASTTTLRRAEFWATVSCF